MKKAAGMKKATPFIHKMISMVNFSCSNVGTQYFINRKLSMNTEHEQKGLACSNYDSCLKEIKSTNPKVVIVTIVYQNASGIL